MVRRYSIINLLKAVLFLITLTFWSGTELFAQVKIGDNPKTIDSGSLLELESSERVLVITRVTTQQMNSLSAMEGALVYNTELGCVHSFNGAIWINLCNQQGTVGVSTAPGNAITNNGGAFYNDANLQNQITETANTLSTHIIDDNDTNAQNELTNLELTGTILKLTNSLTNGNEVDLAPILGNGSGSDNSAFEVANGNLNITDGLGTLSVSLTALNTGGGANLSNTNLIQTGGNRTYNLSNQNLIFSGAGNVGVGETQPQEKLHVGGNFRIDGSLLDANGDAGTTGQILSTTTTGTDWVSPSVSTSPFHAAGKINEIGGLINVINVAAANVMGVGDYRVFFGSNASSANYVVQLTLLNTGAASIEVTAQTVAGFSVQIYDNNGTPINGDWFFSVIDF